jgi:hypothetical protein
LTFLDNETKKILTAKVAKKAQRTPKPRCYRTWQYRLFDFPANLKIMVAARFRGSGLSSKNVLEAANNVSSANRETDFSTPQNGNLLAPSGGLVCDEERCLCRASLRLLI